MCKALSPRPATEWSRSPCEILQGQTPLPLVGGRAFEGERLVFHGYASAEKTIAKNCSPGDFFAFNREYWSLRVEKGCDDGPEKVPELKQRSVEMDFGL